MARLPKSGLEYFPLDVDFFEDEKIVAIAGEFGIKGENVNGMNGMPFSVFYECSSSTITGGSSIR